MKAAKALKQEVIYLLTPLGVPLSVYDNITM